MEWRKYGNHHILSSSSPSPNLFQLHQIILATIRCSDYGPPSDGTSCCFSLPGSPIPCSSTRIDLLPPMVPIIDPVPMSGLPSTIYDHTPWCSGFFKSAWNLLGAETVNAIKSFFSTGFLPSAANSTILTLVPKRPGASAIGDFRPISCCNTLYKAISKLLVHCLKPLLPDLILPNQTAFVQGRLLVENTVLATLYIRWLEACVCTASFSVGYNGTVQGYFKSKRGLRQGDPLSPYLFVVAMNCLSTLLNNAATEGRFGYHQNCEDSKLTHLCFADDLLLHLWATADRNYGNCWGNRSVSRNPPNQIPWSPSLWKGTLEGHHSARVAWDTIVHAKEEGGLGIRDLVSWNKATSIRLIWLLFFSSGSIWVAWFVEEIISGDRSNFRFWSDNWSPYGNISDFLQLQPHSRLGIPRLATVSDLYVDGDWILPPARSDAQVLLQCFISSLRITIRWSPGLALFG